MKAQALRLLSRREHSRAELRGKLLNWAHRQPDLPPSDDADPALEVAIGRTLDDLQSRGLLSDARATESLVAAKAGRYGQHRLRQLMQQRRLPDELVADALQQLRGSERDRAAEVWRRRFGTPASDARERARQIRFLIGRGFDADTAARTVDQGAKDTAPDSLQD
ncbi:MAG: regulatory protein RecX [Rubrivivax sp.]|nr:regulatory protein RecX [Rubrivivax sp.]